MNTCYGFFIEDIVNQSCFQASAGENSGRVWFQQESDQCPGQGSLTVREAGSDKYLPEVRVRVTY